MGKRILIISYFFAPQNAMGAVRPTKLAKYLSRMGHEVTVLCGPGMNDRRDPTLARDLRPLGRCMSSGSGTPSGTGAPPATPAAATQPSAASRAGERSTPARDAGLPLAALAGGPAASAAAPWPRWTD